MELLCGIIFFLVLYFDSFKMILYSKIIIIFNFEFYFFYINVFEINNVF